jgi:hypothetical protein
MGGGRASYKLNFSSVGAVVNDTVCHSKSHGVESFRALRLIRIVADEPHYRMWRGRPRPRMYEPPQPSILVIVSEVGSVAHDRSRAVERSLPAPQPMWGGHSCPPTYESSRTTWGQPPSPCPERSRRRCPPSDAGGSTGASVLARATRTGGHGFSHAEKHRPPIQAPMRRNYSSLVPRCSAGALARERTNHHQPSILVILSEVGSVAHDRSRAVERSLPAPRTV